MPVNVAWIDAERNNLRRREAVVSAACACPPWQINLFGLALLLSARLEWRGSLGFLHRDLACAQGRTN
jgi:hypothetical protein